MKIFEFLSLKLYTLNYVQQQPDGQTALIHVRFGVRMSGIRRTVSTASTAGLRFTMIIVHFYYNNVNDYSF